MAKDVRADIETMRAADTDRQKVADQLKTALDEGRLTLHEYDERVGLAYGAKTYQELLMLLTDLPRPGVAASDVQAEQRRAARRLPTAMLVLWTIWAALTLINLVVWVLVVIGTDAGIYPWPVWMLVPGVALGAVTVGVQVIRHQQRR
jgi:hypothetical protein